MADSEGDPKKNIRTSDNDDIAGEQVVSVGQEATLYLLPPRSYTQIGDPRGI